MPVAKKIKVAGLWLVNSISIPGTTVLGAVEIVPGAGGPGIGKHAGVKMELTPMGVVLRAKGKTAVIPQSNCKAIILADDLEEKDTTA